MGLNVAILAAATVLSFVQGRAQPDGGYAEPGRSSTVALTATAVLGLHAQGAPVPAAARAYLLAHESGLTPTELEIVVMAEAVTGGASEAALGSLRGQVTPRGRIGEALNSTYWGAIALRQAGEPVPAATKRTILAAQQRNGGFPWAGGLAADTDDTSAAVEALVALGVRGRPISRALAFLRTRQNRDGGFVLTPGASSNAQSTAWVIQAFVAAQVTPPARALAFLRRLTRPDGSVRYSARYATTPLWVSAQALPALAGRAFPLR